MLLALKWSFWLRYSAEILAHTYAKDPEIVPVLTELFNRLSGIGLQCLMVAKDGLEEITELVEEPPERLYKATFKRFQAMLS